MDFLSIDSRAANFRATWGRRRESPEFITQRFRRGTPHVGHGTTDICRWVRLLFFISIDCDCTFPEICAVVNTSAPVHMNADTETLTPTVPLTCYKTSLPKQPEIGSFTRSASSSTFTSPSGLTQDWKRRRNGNGFTRIQR